MVISIFISISISMYETSYDSQHLELSGVLILVSLKSEKWHLLVSICIYLYLSKAQYHLWGKRKMMRLGLILAFYL